MELDDLRVYRLAMEVGDRCWQLSEDWPYQAQCTLGRQLIRAADSIVANISEGYGRYHFAENRRFCYYSRGSLSETRTRLKKARNRRLVDEPANRGLMVDLNRLAPMLNAYIRSIGPTDQ